MHLQSVIFHNDFWSRIWPHPLLSLTAGMGHISWKKLELAAVGLALAVSGLISSTFHLGNPQRAWRAVQWQSSWLSVKACWRCSPARFWSVGCGRHGRIRNARYAGICGCRFMCVDRLCYSDDLRTAASCAALAHLVDASKLFGLFLSSGMLLMVMLHPHYDGMAGGALGCLAIAWAVKALWWMRAAKVDVRSGGSNTATATGLADYADVRLFEKPHMTKNYLMKEMVFVVGRNMPKLRI